MDVLGHGIPARALAPVRRPPRQGLRVGFQIGQPGGHTRVAGRDVVERRRRGEYSSGRRRGFPKRLCATATHGSRSDDLASLATPARSDRAGGEETDDRFGQRLLHADLAITEKMLRHFVQKVHPNRWAHPRVVVCVPSPVTGVEKRALEEACLSAGARTAYLIEEPMAAAIAG